MPPRSPSSDAHAACRARLLAFDADGVCAADDLDVPVLRAIGLTVTLGVVFNFVARVAADADRASDAVNVSIAALIPHQGSMCLLERIVDWDERASCWRRTAIAPDNPLRVEDKLRAIHLCEYGAQAMAVHGALPPLARALWTE